MRSKLAYESNNTGAFSGQTIYPIFKRAFEIVFSVALLLFTLPVLVLTMIAIKLESPGPVFYKQERVGLNGKRFEIIKLRSMRTDAEKNGPQWAAKNDPRVTRVGKFIRKTRIDELPQLINILRGDMSLIGPRPERPVFTEKFDKEIPGFKKRLLVKPGLTGWAQVNGGYEMTPAEKFELDMFYIQNQSFKMDMQILFRTVWVVVSGNGAR
ncbi:MULTISPECIES: sugar transferase [Thermoactinomyces]|jgi:exopolysaccharide biosynthesis polyprenyl glycosylphosphotransferase|uniref:Sugar transferase n=1 Tax=Thermoactinomyces vulgaris TaxID=2026 RepID=A0ABS0QFX3_THEVU|nr:MULTISPECIES: sugar transferase [Thermoactinomyces]KYQ86222.1 UDP-phosphate N-acetylgalactosaminyl-1-phosphate transferase [Thermoactinomyces sp. AS95]MBA4551020.1 sugar transferase [Thermoactinomyces vulgaris]MBA4597021.1 sugar transferase [Thermoactinomyces vulgaris]MBH8583564.1 sugar transferase [Thermoactinomyces sp. CICC 10735]MBH8586254.1 sugar transferase [Thermoactinomyces sp. CICC 10520]